MEYRRRPPMPKSEPNGQQPPANIPANLATLASLPGDATIPVNLVSQLLSCSGRHVWRLVDAGLMPAPLQIGRLRRWRVGTLRAWIRDGARPVRDNRRG